MASLRKMYGKEIPEPTGYLVTRWNQDPYSLGSYSYVPVGSKQSLRRQIGMPVENRIFFAAKRPPNTSRPQSTAPSSPECEPPTKSCSPTPRKTLWKTAPDRLISTCEAVPANWNDLISLARRGRAGKSVQRKLESRRRLSCAIRAATGC